MIDKVGGVILKDKKYQYKERKIIVQNVLFLVAKEKEMKQILKH